MLSAAPILSLLAIAPLVQAAPAASLSTARTVIRIAELRSIIGQPATAQLSEGLVGPGYSLLCSRSAEGGPDQMCSLAHAFGRYEIEPSLSLAGGARVSNLRLRVRAGRVTEVTFDVSPDAYDQVQAALRMTYGPPLITRRSIPTEIGALPQVIMRWAGGAHLTDPAPPKFGVVVDLTG